MSCLLSYVAHAEGEKRRGGSTLGTGERAQIHLLHPPPQIQKLADRSDVISEVPKNFTGLRPEPGPRWGSLQRSPDPLADEERLAAPSQEPHSRPRPFNPRFYGSQGLNPLHSWQPY